MNVRVIVGFRAGIRGFAGLPPSAAEAAIVGLEAREDEHEHGYVLVLVLVYVLVLVLVAVRARVRVRVLGTRPPPRDPPLEADLYPFAT